MTIHINKLIELLAKMYEDKNIKAAGTESLKGGVITGLSAVIGGLLLGPIGLAVGGALGGIGSAVAAKEFQPVAVTLRNMTRSEKKILAEYLVAAFRDFGANDVVALLMLLTRNSDLQDLAYKFVNEYLTNQMRLRIKS